MAVSQCVCVRCPQGCVVEVELVEGREPVVRGHACPRGAAYAVAEVTRPERVLTMTVPVVGALEPLSVKTSAPVPKDRLAEVVRAIAGLRLAAPVRCHEVLLANVCGLGVDVVATKSV